MADLRERTARDGQVEKAHGTYRRVSGGAGQVAGGGGTHRRHRRDHWVGVPHRRELRHPGAAGPSLGAVFAAGAGRYHCGTVPGDKGGGKGHQRRNRVGAFREKCAGAAGAGDLCVYGTDPFGGRKRRARGRGLADRRRHRTHHRAAAASGGKGPAPGDPLRHERGVLGPVWNAADGGGVCHGGHQRGCILLRGAYSMPDGGAGGLSGEPDDEGAAYAVYGGGPGAGRLDHGAGDFTRHWVRGGEHPVLPGTAGDGAQGGEAAAQSLYPGLCGRRAGHRTDAAGGQHGL